MKYFKIKYTCFQSVFYGFLYLAFGTWVQAQVKTPQITFLTTEQGLIQNWTEAVYQDRYGFIWIGSREGLNRYDGATFTHFRHHPNDPQSLPHNEVLGFKEDATGLLWIRTASGWCNFRRASETFSPIFFKSNHLIPLPNQTFLWTQGNTVYQYHPKTQTNTEALAQPFPISSNHQTTKGAWLGWRGGLAFLTGQAPAKTFPLPNPNFLPIALGEDQRGDLWAIMATQPNRLGTTLYRFTPSTQTWAQVSPIKSPRHLALARNHHLWINTDEENLIDFNTQTGERRSYPYRLQISSKAAIQMCVDRDGGVWVPTPLDGVLHFDPYQKPFYHLSPRLAFELPKGSDFIMNFAQMPDSTYWIGTLGDGLYHASSTFGFKEQVPAGTKGLNNGLIWWTHGTQNGDLWIGTGNGLTYKKANAARFETKIKDMQVIDGSIARDGILWLALYDKGLGYFDSKTNFFERYDPSFATGGQTAFVQSVFVDQQGEIWTGTEFKGLFRFDPKQKAFLKPPALATSPFHQVWMIGAAKSGGLWLATDAGLCHYQPQTDALKCYGHTEGLNASIVFSFYETDEQTVWIGSSLGLARLNLSTGQVRNFSPEDGVVNTEFNRKAVRLLANGHLAFGGIKGLTIFDPKAILDNPIPPHIVLTHYNRHGRKGPERFSFFDMQELLMFPMEWTFSIDFAGLNFTSNRANRYIYRILGQSEDWQPLGNQRQIALKAMNAGRYTLQVKGMNNDGKWTTHSTDFPIYVVPFFNNSPIWQFFGIVISGLFLYWGYRRRIEQVLRIERLRLRIAGDLHDEVGAQLSSIAIMTDMVRPMVDEKAAQKLTRISSTARQMVGTMRDIVWSIDAQSDTLGHLVSRMQDAAVMLLGRISYTFEIAPDLPNDWYLEMNLRRHNYLIFKEILHNIARHSEATQVSISVSVVQGVFHCTVKDNGKGFDKTLVRQGHGLKNMRERAKEIQADFSLQSAQGTTISWACRLTHLRHLLPAWRRLNLPSVLIKWFSWMQKTKI